MKRESNEAHEETDQTEYEAHSLDSYSEDKVKQLYKIPRTTRFSLIGGCWFVCLFIATCVPKYYYITAYKRLIVGIVFGGLTHVLLYIVLRRAEQLRASRYSAATIRSIFKKRLLICIALTIISYAFCIKETYIYRSSWWAIDLVEICIIPLCTLAIFFHFFLRVGHEEE